MDSKLVSRVLIVGGGVGGMAAAIRMREAGIDVDLVDIDAEWGVYGTGVTLSPLTMRALCDLGLGPDIAAEGNCYDSFIMCDKDGNTIRKMETPRLYSPDMPAEGGILRPVLHRIMKARVLALGTSVKTGVTVDTLEQTENTVEVHLTDGSKGEYDLVVGADGLFSKMRGLIFPDTPKPRFTGQACWRATFPIPEGWDCGHMFLNEGIKLGFTLCSPDRMYLYLLEHVPGNPWREKEELPALLRGLMAGFGGEAAALRDMVTDETPIIYRPLEAILLTETWSKGRVVLLGDAVHATTPHLGSGAGAAVEDAIVLTDELTLADTLTDALASYEARRIPRVSFVVNNSLKIGELEMSGAPMQEQAALMGESMQGIIQPYR